MARLKGNPPFAFVHRCLSSSRICRRRDTARRRPLRATCFLPGSVSEQQPAVRLRDSACPSNIASPDPSPRSTPARVSPLQGIRSSQSFHARASRSQSDSEVAAANHCSVPSRPSPPRPNPVFLHPRAPRTDSDGQPD
ncbi:hypothetical protein FKP32DRAFT_412653 [Trametes sanguinea]|nr:hypothetical protein FKP32DRAFT_412653 [Trametes sanguinea]